MKRGIVFFLLFLIANTCFGQSPVLDEETKKVANQVMLDIYYDILAAKAKHPELSQFDDKVMYENQDGIYAIVYKFQPAGQAQSRDLFEFGLTIAPKGNSIFQRCREGQGMV